MSCRTKKHKPNTTPRQKITIAESTVHIPSGWVLVARGTMAKLGDRFFNLHDKEWEEVHADEDVGMTSDCFDALIRKV